MDSRGDHWGSGVWEAVSVGASKNHSRVSLSVPLDDGMSGVGKAVSKTMVAKTGISHSSNSGSSNHRSVVDHREHRWVVDQGGGCCEDLGVSSNDCGISLPLAIVAMETIAVISNSDRDSVGSHLMADLSRGHLN